MAHKISEECIACGACADQCQQKLLAKGTFIKLIQNFALTVLLVQMFAQQVQFLKNKNYHKNTMPK